ncbi:MAG: hypothetical protein IJS73_05080 [Paludibacteraceae bacterium]|nr:hypothetical protein [Paludibacteraceae bacterium]
MHNLQCIISSCTSVAFLPPHIRISFIPLLFPSLGPDLRQGEDTNADLRQGEDSQFTYSS